MQTVSYNELDNVLTDFLIQQKLPETYRAIAERWFIPVLAKLAQRHDTQAGPLIIGINGCQGSGKSTLAALAVAYFQATHHKSAIAISIDDFYLTVVERKKLAENTHSLLRTRGVPGTHDMALANDVLDALIAGDKPVKIPRFDKSIDDRAPESQWDVITPPVDIIIIEGWCMGAQPQEEDDLFVPVNDLEEFEDRTGQWRKFVNHKLSHEYAEFFARFNHWIMLKAPSFDCVYRWRLEQEEKLLASLKPHQRGRAGDQIMSPQQIRRFIQYYQRVTDHTLNTLPARAQVVFEMDAQRAIVALQNSL